MAVRRYRHGDPKSRTPLGMAVNACADGVMTRRELAERLGMSLSGVNSWAAGTRAPGLDDVARIEQACGRPRGWILSRAGYAPSTVDIEVDEAIRADHMLSPQWRDVLVHLYELAVAASGGRPARVAEDVVPQGEHPYRRAGDRAARAGSSEGAGEPPA